MTLSERLSHNLILILIVSIVLLTTGTSVYVSHVQKQDRFLNKNRLASILDSQAPFIINDIVSENEDATRIRLEYLLLDQSRRDVDLRLESKDRGVIFATGADEPCSENEMCLLKDLIYVDSVVGTLTASVPLRSFFQIFLDSNIFAAYATLLTIFFLIYIRLHYFLKKNIRVPLNKIMDVLSGSSPTDEMAASKFDLYEWKKLKGSILKYQKEKVFAEMASQVVHDLSSPLNGVQVVLSGLKEIEVKDPQYPNFLSLLELSAERLKGIANGLLKEKQNSMCFSVNKIVDVLIREYQHQYASVNFVKIFSLEDIEIVGNPTKLQRAFGNIIKNAIEAMGGRGSITIETGRSDHDAMISIADTGPGMSPEKLKKVLGGGYTERKIDGHGIGMTVVKESIAEFNGKFWAESKVGSGTTFFIQLPLAPEEKIKEISPLVIQMETGKSLVVIDDDPSLRSQWALLAEENNISTILYVSYEELINHNGIYATTAIVDYKFENSEKTGKEVVEYLRTIGFQHLYLCTAEYWKPSIQKMAKQLGVPLCPKPLPRVEFKKI